MIYGRDVQSKVCVMAKFLSVCMVKDFCGIISDMLRHE